MTTDRIDGMVALGSSQFPGGWTGKGLPCWGLPDCDTDDLIKRSKKQAFMSQWREEAFSRFPELEDRFLLCEEAGSELSPHDVWEVLWEAFSAAHKVPRNDGMIRRVYEYCDWCLGQPLEEDLARDVVNCFFEMIPTLPEAVEDMPRWWSRSDVVATREIFSYRVGEEGFARILARFDRPSDLPMG